MSINKMAKEGYTTVFHPREQGVIIHKPGTFTTLTTDNLLLKGNKSEELWSVATDEQQPRESINNTYSILSTKCKLKFLQAAAGFLTKET